jgi:predicted RNase H-like HicB family nuclease
MADRPLEITVRIHDDPDGMWAEVVEYPGVFGAGDTIDEVRRSIVEGLQLVLGDQIAIDAWEPVDDPSVSEHRVLVSV